ncbi:MAG TPA: radical SAM protein [Firmicutes bacterium]|nr:radical SAM protein [Bacillota bacterium]
MAVCKLCGKKSKIVSSALNLCYECIVKRPEMSRPIIEIAHTRARKPYNLPPLPPDNGILCERCGNACRIAEGEKGYCGMVENRGGKLTLLSTASRGYLSFYLDPLPTNCVASWVCPAETGAGYPEYARRDGPEYGFKNLAVFYHSCTYDCLFCQNSHFRDMYLKGETSAKTLAGEVSERVACICYFGGDPVSQIEHSLATSRIALKKAKEEKRVLRICWETNGSMSTRIARQIMEIALRSGGIIKFDIKCADENLHFALTGVSNRQAWKNLRALSEYIPQRPSPPPLVVSTLLVPGYVDEDEVGEIARRVAVINPDIPYSLLAFYPCHKMSDLPTTSKRHASRCYEVAQEAGLTRVHLANLHLLSTYDYE